jgi:hypothetical protein
MIDTPDEVGTRLTRTEQRYRHTAQHQNEGWRLIPKTAIVKHPNVWKVNSIG